MNKCLGCGKSKKDSELTLVSYTSRVCAECKKRMYTCPKCGKDKKLGSQQGLCENCFDAEYGAKE